MYGEDLDNINREARVLQVIFNSGKEKTFTNVLELEIDIQDSKTISFIYILKMPNSDRVVMHQMIDFESLDSYSVSNTLGKEMIVNGKKEIKEENITKEGEQV